jgi:hypothetical protein
MGKAYLAWANNLPKWRRRIKPRKADFGSICDQLQHRFHDSADADIFDTMSLLGHAGPGTWSDGALRLQNPLPHAPRPETGRRIIMVCAAIFRVAGNLDNRGADRCGHVHETGIVPGVNAAFPQYRSRLPESSFSRQIYDNVPKLLFQDLAGRPFLLAA